MDGISIKWTKPTHLLNLKYRNESTLTPPKILGGADGIPKVLKLLKSLYGIKQAPNKIIDKLKAGLLKRNLSNKKLTNVYS